MGTLQPILKHKVLLPNGHIRELKVRSGTVNGKRIQYVSTTVWGKPYYLQVVPAPNTPNAMQAVYTLTYPEILQVNPYLAKHMKGV